MFGPRGNPQAKNLFSVIGYLQKKAGVHLRVALAAHSSWPQKARSAVFAPGVPAIHALLSAMKTWMPGIKPGMTADDASRHRVALRAGLGIRRTG